jgi:replicative DNA helicase
VLSLHRSLDGDLSAGEALPTVYQALERQDIRFHRSSVAMTAGRPGGGKSIFALDHAIKARVPTLYISCDMSRFQLATRAAAALTGDSIATVKETLNGHGREKYRAALKKADHLFLALEKRPDAEALEDVLNCFQERWGIPPHLVVIDNLMNLLSGAENEYAGLREMSHVADYFAHELGACVHLLHHTNLNDELDRPGSMNSVKGKVVELPSLIISASKTEKEFRFSAVKNREGREDPMAQSYGRLILDPNTLTLSDLPDGPLSVDPYAYTEGRLAA